MSVSSAESNAIESILFITKDTYISNDFNEQKGDQSKENFIRVGKSTGNVIAQTLLDIYDVKSLPKGHTVVGVELCLYQYFAGKNAAPIDPFRVNIVKGKWTEDVVASTKPNIGSRIATFYLEVKEGKDCIKFDSEGIEKLQNSNGIIISGGTAGEKKERYFTSSKWLSNSRNIEKEASSLSFHPHWKVKSSGQNMNVGAGHSIVNPGDPVAHSNQTTVIIIAACLGCLFFSIAFVYFLRRRRISSYNSDSDVFESFEDFNSIQDTQLQEVFQMTEYNKAIQRSKSNSRSEGTMNKSIQRSRSNGRSQGTATTASNSSTNSKTNSRHDEISDDVYNQNRGRNQERYRDQLVNEATVSTMSCPSTNDSINTNRIIDREPDPCSINNVCMKVVHRKECDIDYVAPGVASVVDRQCTIDNPRDRVRSKNR